MISRLHLVTGRDILDHLISGERNPKVLAQLARTAARRKIAELEEALEGAEFFTAEHAALLATMLARVDGAFIWIACHDQRQCSLSTVSLRGCDHCRPATAVQVRRPQ